MPTYKRAVLRIYLSLLVCSVSARAQFENGSLVGTVRGTTDAIVAGATITVTNTATGIASRILLTAAVTGKFRLCAWEPIV